MVLFVVLRAQIVRTILGTGEFDWSATRLTAACLALFVFSITAQSLVLLFVRGYYAMGNTRKPLFVNVFSSTFIVGFAVLLNWAFTKYDAFRYFIESIFRIENVGGAVVLMLALSYSLGVIINALVLIFIFQKDFKKFSFSISTTFWHSLFSSLIMGFVAYKLLDVFALFLDTKTLLGIFLQGLFPGLIGLVAGIFVLWLLGSRELREIGGALNNKIWKNRVIIPEKREL